MAIPTFLDVLEQAAVWRAENTKEALEKARAVLVRGMKEYDDALPLGDELVLVLKGLGEIDNAIAKLRHLDLRFQEKGEETLCRWGSLIKLRANQTLASRGISKALLDFQESERFYARAYEQHRTFYPRINELTTRFVCASLTKELGREKESAELLRDVESKAREMLINETLWAYRKPDDAVWSPASRGEANILLLQWPDAEAAYTQAIREACGKKFYHDCMRDQIRDVLMPAFERLHVPFEGALADPDRFFAV